MWLISLLATAIAYAVLSRRLRTLETQFTYEGEITELWHRVSRLEEAVSDLEEQAKPALRPTSVAKRESSIISAGSVSDPVAGEASYRTSPAPPSSAPIQEPAIPQDNSTEMFSAPSSSVSDRLRDWVSQNDWEALLGGNVLNKIGALLLVIGIALFSGYSFHRVGPAARASAALVMSIAILAGGIRLERRSSYQVFGRGLIGAGWAALYATTYAIYALPAARLFDNAFIGSIIQLAVAALMILYSLRYQSQTVTSLAYFAAFLALAVTPSSPFAVLSLIPLSASLLYLAHRFDWHRIALLGLIATYVTCASRGSSGAPIWLVQSLFIVYWLIFELFDLLRVHRRLSGAVLPWIFPLNAIGFIGLSYGAWYARSGELWIMATLAAVLYAGSTLARLIIRPPSAFASENLSTRLEQGSFEGACALAALMSGMAIVAKVPGVWKSLGLALEAELLYLAGVRFRLRFLQRMGFTGFFSSLAGTWLNDAVRPGHTLIFGHPVLNWTPSVALHVLTFYLNRAVEKNDRIFSYLASGLLAVILGGESPAGYTGLLWMSMGAVLFELGWRKNLAEFRWQGSVVAALGTFAIVWEHGSTLSKPAPNAVWISLLMGSAIAWSFAIRMALAGASLIPKTEVSLVRDVAATMGAILLAMATAVLVPREILTITWFTIACGCFWLGLIVRTPSFRWLAQGIMLCAFAHFAFVDFGKWWHWYLPAWAFAAMIFQWIGRRRNWSDLRFLSHWVVLLTLIVALGDVLFSSKADTAAKLAIVATIAVFYTLQLLTDTHEASSPTWFARFESYARALFSVYGTVLLTAFLWAQVSGKVLTMACGLEGLVLLAAGFPLRDRALRLPGLALLLGCVCKLFLYDLRNLESFYRTLSFIALGAILLGVSWIYTRFRDRLRQYL